MIRRIPPKMIAIGVVTKDRPAMLARLLASFVEMDKPADVQLAFVVIENADTASLGAQVAQFEAAISHKVLYDIEPEPGIPFARNAVLERALTMGADILTFVDDDERVDQGWLVALVQGLWDRDLDLVGGPLRIEAETPVQTFWQSAVLGFLQQKAGRNEARRAERTANGTDGTQDAYTNNWALRLSFAAQHGLRFDGNLRYTGGSDTAFSIALKAAGGRRGWVPDAVVYDRIPLHRLSLGYHYRRSRDQARNGAILRKKPLWKAPFFMLARFVEAAVLVLISPIKGRVALVRAVHNIALADGRLRGALGFKSSLYAPKT
ncbi:glycosyltransferase family 2 protein [Algirhabdus cladophorae]|uniref:glycosyltransferase family 2 protein n=1 Tax=Algirhabdus cladophorae TaxID=3377108 RepID=UPI003B84A57E